MYSIERFSIVIIVLFFSNLSIAEINFQNQSKIQSAIIQEQKDLAKTLNDQKKAENDLAALESASNSSFILTKGQENYKFQIAKLRAAIAGHKNQAAAISESIKEDTKALKAEIASQKLPIPAVAPTDKKSTGKPVELPSAAPAKALNSVDTSTIDGLMTNLSMTQDLNDLVTKTGSAENALDRMESRFDNLALGAYLKEKFGLFVNSDLVCKAQRRCSVVEPKPIPADALNEIFSDKVPTRTDYYKKVQKTGVQ